MFFLKNQERFSNELKNAKEGDQVIVVIKGETQVDILRVFSHLHFREKIILEDLPVLNVFNYHKIHNWIDDFWTDKAKTELMFSFTITNIPLTPNDISKISSIISEMIIVSPGPEKYDWDNFLDNDYVAEQLSTAKVGDTVIIVVRDFEESVPIINSLIVFGQILIDDAPEEDNGSYPGSETFRWDDYIVDNTFSFTLKQDLSDDDIYDICHLIITDICVVHQNH